MGKLVVKQPDHGQRRVRGAEPGRLAGARPGQRGRHTHQLVLWDAMVLGRKTYEGLAAVWPQLADHPGMGRYADRINAMPKYVASRTLSEPLEWNARLLTGDLDRAIPALKAELGGNLFVSGCGELAHALTRQALVDEFWFWVNPSIWATGPRIVDGVGPVRLDLVSSTPYRSGVLWLRYRPAAG